MADIQAADAPLVRYLVVCSNGSRTPGHSVHGGGLDGPVRVLVPPICASAVFIKFAVSPAEFPSS